MSDYDVAALLRSPLEDEPRRRGWFVPSLVLGAVGAFLGVAMTGNGAVTEASPDTSIAAPTTIVADPFPAGYTPLSDELAVAAGSPIDIESGLLVPLTLVAARDAGDEVPRLLGGRWRLESDVATVDAAAVNSDPLRPGVFSLTFAAPTDEPRRLRLLERWDGRTTEATTQVAFESPFALAEPLEIDAGDGVTVTIERLDLGRFLGELDWSLEGAGGGVVDVGLRLLRDDGEEVGVWAPGLPASEPSVAGHIAYRWPFGIRIDQRQATTLEVLASVTVAVVHPADVVVELPTTD